MKVITKIKLNDFREQTDDMTTNDKPAKNDFNPAYCEPLSVMRKIIFQVQKFQIVGNIGGNYGEFGTIQNQKFFG